MAQVKLSVTRARSRKLPAVALLGLTLLIAQAVGHSQAGDALPYANGYKSYFIPGNYVVGSVDLAPQNTVNGALSGEIEISGVPQNADILAAFLYWETISTNIAQVDGAKFRGRPITVVKASSVPLTGNNASCWSSGGGVRSEERRVGKECRL